MIALWVGLASAELPPPDYREQLLAAVEGEADARIAEGDLDGALDLVQRFRKHVTEDARLVYEEGLVRRLQGDTEEAEALYAKALEMDPSLGFAWYDLGELHLASGDLDAAELAFARATALTAEHPNGWAGPFRQAELAGRRGDALAFDQHLKVALSRGFVFRTVAGDPTWTAFLRDPVLGDVMTRLMTVYGEEQLLKEWKSP
ncbi:MAG TPA: tetratricopeptide repeat protein [Myxococcota bacterium]|nr:tetratricopeptide repeat protein [Myxococcota bacterium]